METQVKNDLNEMDEIIRERGTVKGSDYVYAIADQVARKAKYSEKGWF